MWFGRGRVCAMAQDVDNFNNLYKLSSVGRCRWVSHDRLRCGQLQRGW